MSTPPPPPGQNPPPYQGPQGYQTPPPGYQPYGGAQGYPGTPPKNNGLAIASLVLGIIGIPLCGLFAIPALLAIIFGAVARKQIAAEPAKFTGRGLATAGLILGVIGVVLLVVVLAVGNTRFTVNR